MQDLAIFEAARAPRRGVTDSLFAEMREQVAVDEAQQELCWPSLVPMLSPKIAPVAREAPANQAGENEHTEAGQAKPMPHNAVAMAKISPAAQGEALDEDIPQQLHRILNDLGAEGQNVEALASDMVDMLDLSELDRVVRTPQDALSLLLEASDRATSFIRAVTMHQMKTLLSGTPDFPFDKISLPDDVLRKLALHPDRMAEQARLRHGLPTWPCCVNACPRGPVA